MATTTVRRRTRELACFACELPLRQTVREGVEIDYCPHCRSIWLDRGELEKMIDRLGDAYAPVPPDTAWRDDDRSLGSGRAGSFGDYFDVDHR